jgi:RNA polymerase primary sigma factor
VSFDATIGGEEGGRKILETIPDKNSLTPDDLLDRERISKIISASLSRLSKREEQVMRLRFGLSDVEDKSIFEISEEEVNKLEAKK